MYVVGLFRKVSIPDDLVSVWEDTKFFGLKWCHEIEGR